MASPHRKVQQPAEVELAGSHVLHHLLGDLLGLHSGSLLEGDDIGGDLLVGFQLLADLAGPVAVPEIGDMAVLLRLGHGVLPDACLAENLGQSVLDDGGLQQVILREVQIGIVLQHTGKLDTGVIAAVELIEIVSVEGQGKFPARGRRGS